MPTPGSPSSKRCSASSLAETTGSRGDIIDGPHHETYGSAVISSWRQRNRGKRSGVEVEMDTAVVWTFQGERIIHAAAFGSGADARAAIGMPPSPPPAHV